MEYRGAQLDRVRSSVGKYVSYVYAYDKETYKSAMRLCVLTHGLRLVDIDKTIFLSKLV